MGLALCTRWKTEEGEWVIARVLARVLPTHAKKKESTTHNDGPLTSLSCVGFFRLSSQKFGNGKHRWEKKENCTKKVGLVPQNLGKHRLRAWEGEEVSWFYGGPNLIWNYEQSLICHGGQLKLNKYSVNAVCLLVSLKREHRPIEEMGKHIHFDTDCPPTRLSKASPIRGIVFSSVFRGKSVLLSI